MRILAIETSGNQGSLATLDATGITEVALPKSLSTLQSLAPAIDKLLAADRSVDAIAVTSGPGSFTGLRLGLTTAKMLGMAWKIPLIGIDTLEVIARQQEVATQVGYVVPVINAFRGQVFSAVWECDGALWRQVAASQVVDARAWQAAPLRSLGVDTLALGQVVLVGPGLEKFQPAADSGCTLGPSSAWQAQAGVVARLGAERWQQGHAADALHLLPNYIRDSAAVENARSRS